MAMQIAKIYIAFEPMNSVNADDTVSIGLFNVIGQAVKAAGWLYYPVIDNCFL